MIKLQFPLAENSIRQIATRYPEYLETCIDIGVQNQSEFLIAALPSSHHVLVEPAKEYYPFIEKNYKNIQYTLLKAAASDVSGTLQLISISNRRDGKVTHTQISATMTEDEFHKLQLEDPAYYIDLEPIAAMSLDEITEKAKVKPYRYGVKIDVDGLEARIIRASEYSIQNASCLIVESTTGVRYKSDRDIGDMIDLASSKGMRLIDIVSPCYYNGKLAQVDLIFLNSNIFEQYMERDKFDSDLWQSDKVIKEIIEKADSSEAGSEKDSDI